jgi:hypothetical protein
LFFIFKKGKHVATHTIPINPEVKEIKWQNQAWKLQFDAQMGGPSMPIMISPLISWTKFADSSAKYYAGTATYSNMFNWSVSAKKSVVLTIDSLYNVATVKVNGINCGTIWTPPYAIDITKALHTGTNTIAIDVTNTWNNRLIGDNRLPINRRITFTTAPFRLKDKPLLPAGIIGAVKIIETDASKGDYH